MYLKITSRGIDNMLDSFVIVLMSRDKVKNVNGNVHYIIDKSGYIEIVSDIIKVLSKLELSICDYRSKELPIRAFHQNIYDQHV